MTSLKAKSLLAKKAVLAGHRFFLFHYGVMLIFHPYYPQLLSYQP